MARALITGVTGFLGRHLLWRRLRKSAARDRVLCLIRAQSDAEAASRLARILDDPQCNLTAAQKARALAVRGDLAEEHLGLPRAEFERLAAGLTDLVHCAASVKFTLDLALARRINVDGTRRMLDLARRATHQGSLRRFDYIGTAFVAGKRQGLVREDELDLAAGNFHNTYERTKAESERVVRDAAGEVPVTIFRPSVVVGDSRTGITQSFNVLYWPLKVFSRGWVLCIPADPKGLVDIVPIDFVTDAIEWIREREEPRGECFHIAAGPEKAVTIEVMARHTKEAFGVRRMPPFVSPQLFNRLLKPLFRAVLFGPYRKTLLVGEQYVPYLSYRALFDTTNARRALAGSGIEAPLVLDYYHLLIAYCLASEWGKRRLSAQEIAALAQAPGGS